jgi:hypothetical protein
MHNDSSVLQISYNEEDDLLPFDKNLIKFALKQMNKDFLAHLEKEMIVRRYRLSINVLEKQK